MSFRRLRVRVVPVLTVALLCSSLLSTRLPAQAPAAPPPTSAAGSAANVERIGSPAVLSVDRRDDTAWDRAGDRRDRRGASTLFAWSGTVDSDLFIIVRGRDVTTQGRDRELPFRVRMNNGLPRESGTLVVEVDEGRGSIGVIEQPSRRNGYQAVIRIQDPRGGADRYRLTAYWRDDNFRDRDDWDWDDRSRDRDRDRDRDRNGSASGGALQWRGQVDDVVEIRIQGRRVESITRSGARLSEVRSDVVGAGLPRRAVDVVLYPREGRGELIVVQQPNARNDFTAVIRLVDPRGGAGFYDFSARW